MSQRDRLESYHFYERDWNSYEDLCDAFEWEMPDQFNMATYVCDRWADDKNRVAMFAENVDGETRSFTYWQFARQTDQLAHVLLESGVEAGDRVAINLPQKPETMLAHVAVWKIGAVSVPMSTLFGPDAVEYRLTDSDAVVGIVDESNIDDFRQGSDQADGLSLILTVGDVDAKDGERAFWDAISDANRYFETRTTSADDDAIVLYTSGTTGKPKGALREHSDLLAFVPMLVLALSNMDVENGDVFWSPSEWAWIGTLYCIVLPPMFYGKTLLAYEGGSFDPEEAYRLIERYGVTNYYAPPTVLRMMMGMDNYQQFDVDTVYAIGTGGEEVGQQLIDWANDTFGGAAVNQIYGQTEANPLTLDCEAMFDRKPGTIGKAMPGVDITIVDPETAETVTESGTVGEIAVDCSTSPICFSEYLGKPEATSDKWKNGYLLTEDLGSRNEDGYFSFHSRKDDVIISSGYRIGPAEVEECLTGHDAVSHAGVIGVPHGERGQIPKAFVELANEYEDSETLRSDLKDHVKDRLAKYEYPRVIEVVEEVPKTVTGKIQRSALRELEGVAE